MRASFFVIAFAFVIGAVVHAVALVDPSIVEPSPPWRHALFLAINIACAIGMVTRPRFFVGAFAALVAQQLVSHTMQGVDVWRREARIDWASIVVIVTMPIVLALLVRDARASRATPTKPSGT